VPPVKSRRRRHIKRAARNQSRSPGDMEIDLSRLDAATRGKVDDIFRRDFDLKVLKAVRRQTMVAARNHLHRPRAQEGFGERTVEIDAYIDALWRNFYGPSYTQDTDLLKFLIKRNPEIKVRSQGTKLQFGWAPTLTRFSKTYPTARKANQERKNQHAEMAQ
jgi:hypothetical protein